MRRQVSLFRSWDEGGIVRSYAKRFVYCKQSMDMLKLIECAGVEWMAFQGKPNNWKKKRKGC